MSTWPRPSTHGKRQTGRRFTKFRSMPKTFSWKPMPNCGRWILLRTEFSCAAWRIIQSRSMKALPRPWQRPAVRPPCCQRTPSQVSPLVSQVDAEKCIGCGLCTEVCAFGAIVLEEVGRKGQRAKNIPASCKGCGLCASSCPQHAIDMLHFRRPADSWHPSVRQRKLRAIKLALGYLGERADYAEKM